MVCLMSIMRNTRSEDTVSTEQATALYLSVPQSSFGMDLKNSKIIVAHLGNGASISAVLNSECVDTSMGLTPLEGLVMGTRSGDIDPAIMEFIAKKENLDIEGIMNVLNKKSGVQGMSGLLLTSVTCRQDTRQATSLQPMRSRYSAIVWQNTSAPMSQQ